MDAQAKKAFFRAKLNAQKKEKRIDSPLVRYNEYDQPVCRVCGVVLKSESLWDAHQVSRKHREAISNIKASAAGQTVGKAKAEPPRELSKPKHKHTTESHNSKTEHSTNLPKPPSSSGLPADFFDNHEMKGQKSGTDAVTLVNREQYKKPGSSQTQMIEYDDSDDEMNGSSNATAIPSKEIQSGKVLTQRSTQAAISVSKQQKGALPEGFFDSEEADLPVHGIKPTGSETQQQKGALPEGFFDNKEADLRARGIKPVKVDVRDEYKEFEKLIEMDLKDVDDRLEEEENDAAEMIEASEKWAQEAYQERLEMLKRKKLELAARSAKRSRATEAAVEESGQEESSSDDDTDENFAVDWRAQHL